MDVIALDIGHSAVKVVAGSERLMFPTAARPAVSIDLDEARAAARRDTVTVDGQDFIVGETALIHTDNELATGLNDDWIETKEHLALLTAGYERGKRALGAANPFLVLGLPSRAVGKSRQRLVELAAMTLQIDKSRVRVVPQALGAYMSSVLDESGDPVADRDIAQERVGIIDIGYFTTDFGLIHSGQWSAAGQRSAEGANVLVAELARAIERKFGVPVSARAADVAMCARSIKIRGTVHALDDLIDPLAAGYASKLIDSAKAVFGAQLPLLDHVVIAGGAAGLVFRTIRDDKDFAHATTLPAARYAVADGMHRYGLLKAKAAEAVEA